MAALRVVDVADVAEQPLALLQFRVPHLRLADLQPQPPQDKGEEDRAVLRLAEPAALLP